MKILVVDNDVEIGSILAELLGRDGFSVEFEQHGVRGLSRALSGVHDLLILDVVLQGLDGFEALSHLRQQSQMPVLILTALSGRRDRVRCLQLGADDYLLKPFDAKELLARVHGIMRRSAGVFAKAPEALQVGELTLLPGARSASYRGQKVDLTAMECEILEQLMRAPGHAVSRDQLSLRLYDRPASPFDRSLDTHVSRIRRKLGDGGGFILSVRGTGYQLCTPDSKTR